jgi:hypothetical protein
MTRHEQAREALDRERRRYLAGWNYAREVEGDLGVRWVNENGEPLRGYYGEDYTPEWPHGSRCEILGGSGDA